MYNDRNQCIWGTVMSENLSAAHRKWSGSLAPANLSFYTAVRGQHGRRLPPKGGKTSLLLALFRLLRIEGGHIAIDGVDIGTLPLPLLRARMAVIPQDPVLFAGTVRYNLDPTGQAPDQKLWDALRVAQLGKQAHPWSPPRSVGLVCPRDHSTGYQGCATRCQ